MRKENRVLPESWYEVPLDLKSFSAAGLEQIAYDVWSLIPHYMTETLECVEDDWHNPYAWNDKEHKYYQDRFLALVSLYKRISDEIIERSQKGEY